ncbi:ferredoxin [Bacteroidia bacterium]|nr:ferredoxin [Bacteroidia bacterium]
MNALKIIRVILAVAVFSLLTVFFCDFTGHTPRELHIFAHLQLVPLLMAGAVGALIVLFLLTFLFGRIYCSVVCPLGIFQDILAWFTKRGKKKNKKKRWYHYQKPYNIVRYSLLAICILFLLFGSNAALVYLDPYSNFGRIAANIFRPIVVAGNNALNWMALQFNNYDFYQITIHTISVSSFVIALISLLLVGVLAVLHGRLFCNTICPVGSFLGLISRFSIFKITIDESKCTKCGVCAKACKSECIDSKGGKIDASRCVTCFNCLERCNQRALIYKPGFSMIKKQQTSEKETDTSRRQFLTTSVFMAASVPAIPAWAKGKKTVDVTKLRPITPPGSKSLKHFTEKCTACHLCITHCPQQILKPAGFSFGWNYAFKPYLSFYEGAFCNYNCKKCSSICPNGAIEPLTIEEKRVTQIGIAQFERDRCVVFTDHTSCGACSEHCPVQAVKMEPYEDGLTIPHVYEYLCIGCGGCESICPVRPVKAINVLANTVHQTAERPKDEPQENQETQELDFGF